LRTTNLIESAFATGNSLSLQTARLMVFKLIDAASKSWHRFNGTNQLSKFNAGCQIRRRHRGHSDRQSHAA